MSRAPLSLADTWPFSDDRCDRAPILAAWTRAANVRRCDGSFKFRPLGIRQDSHLVSPPMPNEIRRVVISASHEMRTDPSPHFSSNQVHWGTNSERIVLQPRFFSNP